MWALFITSGLAFIAIDVLQGVQKEALLAGDMDKYKRLKPYFNESLNISLVTLMAGHWIFAVKYAEVILKLPLLVFPDEMTGNLKCRMKIISCAIWSLNGFFAAIVIAYTILFQLYIFDVVDLLT